MNGKIYNVCIDSPFLNCDRVYPMAQKKVKKLLDVLNPKQNKNINRIILFGSSITDDFHIDSDIDIYVETEKEEKLINEYIPFEFDLWTNFQTDESLEKEIRKKGITIYERDIM